MEAKRDGRSVVLTMTAEEAEAFEDELLWCRPDDPYSKQAWEAFHALSEGDQP